MDVTLTSSKEKENDELSYTVAVTRYGPQSVASATRVKRERKSWRSFHSRLEI